MIFVQLEGVLSNVFRTLSCVQAAIDSEIGIFVLTLTLGGLAFVTAVS